MKFSQRIGKTQIKNVFQLDYMDNDLRVGLWNCYYVYYGEKSISRYSLRETVVYPIIVDLWMNLFKFPADSLPEKSHEVHAKLRDWFMKNEWYKIYDFIEFLIRHSKPLSTIEFKEACNATMERELSGYRIVSDTITPITNEQEIKEIEEAITNSSKTKTTGINTHLKTALSKLSDRKNPDYRNSIKESVSAVEAISQVITGKTRATLGAALKIIEQNINLHSALKKGFEAIYGYTSDADGIRHAMSEDSNLDFEDAKYMLASCSAFINYLIIKGDKAGIHLK